MKKESIVDVAAHLRENPDCVLATWQMICPQCRRDKWVEIETAQPTLTLLLDGGKVDVAVNHYNHSGGEFESSNMATCQHCGYSSNVCMFENEGRYLFKGLTGKHCAENFPDFDSDICAFLLPGWLDVSWRNDACPSIFHEESGATIFLDYRYESKRENPGFNRFSLSVDSDIYAESSDVLEVVAWMRNPYEYIVKGQAYLAGKESA